MNLGKEDNHDAELQLHGSRSPSVDGPASRLRRYREKEGRSLAGFGLHPDPPPVPFHNALADSQSHARPGVLAVRV